ncbi:hypothetical protein AB0G06_21570 [Nonomuraea dietziae]|uniref:hypothetical protein n=1 Tax=Nonomuraea dietziae TaxID=65515 RepID=UPI0033D78194
MLAAGARPTLTLVGHSAGSVYVNHLLHEVAQGRRQGYRAWPDDVRFRVAFLAPACTYAHFSATLEQADDLIEDLRVFTMTDEAEQADRLAGAVYPRSLLYLVSGVLERDDTGESNVQPVLWLARHRRPDLTDEQIVLPPTHEGAPVGRRAGARSHSAFDEDPLVLESLNSMIVRT